MSTSSKGAEIERKAIAVLKRLGYRQIHRAIRTPVARGGFVFSNSNDVFGVFDIIAARPDAPLLCVQVTTKEKMRVRERKVAPVAADFPLKHTVIQVWGWVGGRRGSRDRKGTIVSAQGFRVTQWAPELAEPGRQWIGQDSLGSWWRQYER